MKAVKIHTKTDPHGVANIEVETGLGNSEVDLIVVIENRREMVSPSVEKKEKSDLSDLIGKLKWKGDPLKMQKELRDEWL